MSQYLEQATGPQQRLRYGFDARFRRSPGLADERLSPPKLASYFEHCGISDWSRTSNCYLKTVKMVGHFVALGDAQPDWRHAELICRAVTPMILDEGAEV